MKRTTSSKSHAICNVKMVHWILIGIFIFLKKKNIMNKKKQNRNILKDLEQRTFKYVENIRGTFIFLSFETPSGDKK